MLENKKIEYSQAKHWTKKLKMRTNNNKKIRPKKEQERK